MPAGSTELCVRIVHHGTRTSIAVDGELDLSNRSVLRSHLDYVITDAPGDVELDLGGLGYIDSSGLAEILNAYSRLLDQGRELRITKVSHQGATLFDLCGITHLFDDWATPPARPSIIAPSSPPEDAAARPVLTSTPGRAAVNPLVR